MQSRPRRTACIGSGRLVHLPLQDGRSTTAARNVAHCCRKLRIGNHHTSVVLAFRYSRQLRGSMVAHAQTETNAGPRIRELTRDEMEALLTRNNVGRIAYAFKDRVDIEPINYVYKDGWVYCRTSHGSKLETMEHHRWVAFEVDEVRGLFD